MQGTWNRGMEDRKSFTLCTGNKTESKKPWIFSIRRFNRAIHRVTFPSNIFGLIRSFSAVIGRYPGPEVPGSMKSSAPSLSWQVLSSFSSFLALSCFP